MKTQMYCLLGVLVFGHIQAEAKSVKKEKSNRTPANVICEEKAKSIATSVHRLEWPDMQIQSVSAHSTSSTMETISYSVVLDVGGKFDLQMNLKMSPSGPQACYLVSLEVPAR